MGYVCPGEAPAHDVSPDLRSHCDPFRALHETYGTVTYGVVASADRVDRLTSASHQLQQEWQLLVGVPGQIVVLRVADDQIGVLIAQVGGVDGLDGLRHRGLGPGVVDVRGDHVVDRHRP